VLWSADQAMPGWTAAVLKTDADEPAAPGEVGRVAMDLASSPLAWFKGYTGDVGRFDQEGYF
jgi:acetyl-CoA synthetase